MTFVLSKKNAIDYLAIIGVCDLKDRERIEIYPQGGKNFNLLVRLQQEDRHLTLKQERLNRSGQLTEELFSEWYVREAIEQFRELEDIHTLIPRIAHFDRDNGIIAIEYLANHVDLLDFYHRDREFDPKIGKYIGQAIGRIHQLTYQQASYEDFFNRRQSLTVIDRLILTTPSLKPITPEMYSQLPTAGIKFLSLCQRYQSLTTAIKQAIAGIKPCCITHNDFKLNNILLADNWETSEKLPLKIIDWERCGWGDPAVDLGFAIASYLQLWIESMVVTPAISIEDSLRMATIPLYKLHPSIESMVRAYLDSFPMAIASDPRFLLRVIQFAGIALLQQIQATIQYYKSFNNTGIYTLQIAKSLICRPETSISTVFGVDLVA